MLCSEITKQRTYKPALKDWVEFAELVLTRIVLFNKRRISEVEKLKIIDFKNRLTGDDMGDQINALETSERILAKRMDLIEVRGKSTRGIRKVFILLTQDMVKAIDHVLMTRIFAGINPLNPYVFGRTSLNPLDGCRAVRNVVKLCPSLNKPENIRSTLLRRYMATTSQLLDMTGDELKLVADHMGHSIAIHTDIYRMQTSTLERTKVARALIALESGMLGKFKGRNLHSIDINEFPLPYDQCIGEAGQETEDHDLGEILPEDIFECDEEPEADLQVTENDSPESRKCDEEPEVDLQVTENDSPESRKSNIKEVRSRKPWSNEENEAFKSFFQKYIHRKCSSVHVSDMRNMVLKRKCLEKRSLAQIRVKLNNMKLGKSQ